MLICGLLPATIDLSIFVEALPMIGNSLTMASINNIKPANLFIFSLLSYKFMYQKAHTIWFSQLPCRGRVQKCKEMQKTRILTAFSDQQTNCY